MCSGGYTDHTHRDTYTYTHSNNTRTLIPMRNFAPYQVLSSFASSGFSPMEELLNLHWNVTVRDIFQHLSLESSSQKFSLLALGCITRPWQFVFLQNLKPNLSEQQTLPDLRQCQRWEGERISSDKSPRKPIAGGCVMSECPCHQKVEGIT